ncbi:hypothetical protein ES705_44383 [subsurface metagenome]
MTTGVHVGIVASATVEGQDELVAEEDMKIVGCSFHAVHTQDGNTYLTLQRGGQQRMLNNYQDGMVAVDGDEQIAGTRITMPGAPNTSTGAKGETIFMFPAGHYFEVEEGERIYLNYRLQNDDTNTHTMMGQCLIYWV